MTESRVQANVSTLLQEQFLNNQDVMSAAMQSLGIQGVQSLSDTIANQISTVVTSSFLSALRQQIALSQVITVKSSTTTSVNNVTQSSILNIVQQTVSKNKVSTSAYAESVFNDISNLVNQQNTLDEVGNVVFKATTTFTKAIDSSVGMVMMAVLVLLGVVVAAIVGFIIYRRVQRAIDLAKNLERSTTLPTETSPFQQF